MIKFFFIVFFKPLPALCFKFKENIMIKVLENKIINKGKVNFLTDGNIILSVPKKKTYKKYLKEIAKLKF